MMNQLSDVASTRRDYIPGSGTNTIMSSSRRSPNIRSEVDSLKFDLDEDDPTPTSKNTSTLTARKNWKSVVRDNHKINDAKAVPKGYISKRSHSRIREKLNITTPNSLPVGYSSRPNSNEYQNYNSNLNKSVYGNLQHQIDRQRSHIPQSPPVKSKISIYDNSDQGNFTDISKIKPKADLPPLEIKNKLNLDIPGTLPVKSNRDVQKMNSHTTAFLYSKVSTKPKIKKSNIVQISGNDGEFYEKPQASTKLSLQHKSTASSLIATLGQRNRDKKVLNSYPFRRNSGGKNPKEILDSSPRISTEKVRLFRLFPFL